ncbi:MAG: YiiG family protein [Pseudolabrys sp.]|nr:YiiG family protein [Pseudolabrys sp.]
MMKFHSALWLAIAGLFATSLAAPALAPAAAQAVPGVEKMNAYVGCINRLSERSYQSRDRYFDWVKGKNGPTGKERIVYGTYTIYDTTDCKKNVEKANALEPHDAALEAAATAYAAAVGALEPLLKEADDYYSQENYKDDKMAKGKALHPRLVAAWSAFATADKGLRENVEAINDKRALARLAEIESKEGRKARFHIEALMIEAKRVLRAENTEKPDIGAITKAIADYEAAVKAAEDVSGTDPAQKIGGMFISNAKSYLTTAKQLMRRIRDKTPYSAGDRMMLGQQGAGWMVEGSPPRLLRDYNQLIDAYNRGARI